MANQYQIYGATLSDMCNMYRYINDSNETFPFGELANKIKNFRKDPIYPEGCTIVNCFINRYQSSRGSLIVHPLSQKPSGADKISLDGSANSYAVYNIGGDFCTHIYTDSNPMYSSKILNFDSTLEYIFRDDFYGVKNNLYKYANFDFFWGEAASSYGQPGDDFIDVFHCAYDTENIMRHFPNLRSVLINNSQIVNEVFLEWIKNNSRIVNFKYNANNFATNFNFIPRYANRFQGLTNSNITNIPSTVHYIDDLKDNLYQPYETKITVQSPYIIGHNFNAKARSRYYTPPGNKIIEGCNDIILGTNCDDIFGDYGWGANGIYKDIIGFNNIYLMSPTNAFYRYFVFDDENSVINKTINIRGFNNKPIKIKYDYFFSAPRINNSDLYINVQSDIYFASSYCYAFGDLYTTDNGGFSKMPHLKNIYCFPNFRSNSINTRLSINFFSCPKIEEGAFVEKIIQPGTEGLWSTINITDNIKTPPLTVNKYIYSYFFDFTLYGPWKSEQDYKLNIYTEKNLHFAIDDINSIIKGDFYLWENEDFTNSSSYIWMTCNPSSKYNIHIKRNSFNYNADNKHLSRLFISSGSINIGGLNVNSCFTKIGDGHYVEENWGLVHVYEHDNCPFEVNKELPNYDWTI